MNLYDSYECGYCGRENWREDGRASCVGCGAPLKWRKPVRDEFAVFAYGKPFDVTVVSGSTSAVAAFTTGSFGGLRYHYPLMFRPRNGTGRP